MGSSGFLQLAAPLLYGMIALAISLIFGFIGIVTKYYPAVGIDNWYKIIGIYLFTWLSIIITSFITSVSFMSFLDIVSIISTMVFICLLFIVSLLVFLGLKSLQEYLAYKVMSHPYSNY
jgi:hypothetical protein